MTKLCALFNHLLILVFLLALCSCLRQKGVEDILSKAENMLEQQPDSALCLLETVPVPEDLNKERFNKYHLLLIQAKDKCYMDITSDTIIFAVKDYYVRKKDLPNAALATIYCGRVWEDSGKHEAALSEFLKADEQGEKLNNTGFRGLAQSHIGDILLEKLLQTEAIEHFKTAALCFRETGNVKNEIISYRQIGNACLMSSLNDSAFYYYDRGLRLAAVNNDSSQIADLSQCLGVAYRKTGNCSQADVCLRKAAEYSPDSDNKALLYLNLSKTFYDSGLLDSAKVYADQSLSLLTNTSDVFVATDVFKTLSKIAEAKSEDRQSLEYYKKYADNLVKIVDENKNKEILELLKKYNNQRLQNENYQMKIRNQKLYISFSIAFCMVGSIAVWFYTKSEDRKKLVLKKEKKYWKPKTRFID